MNEQSLEDHCSFWVHAGSGSGFYMQHYTKNDFTVRVRRVRHQKWSSDHFTSLLIKNDQLGRILATSRIQELFGHNAENTHCALPPQRYDTNRV